MKILDICQKQVITITPNDSIRDVAEIMREHNVGDVIVVDEAFDPTPIGILTDRDIVVEILGTNVELDAVRVSDVMSLDILTLNQDMGITEATQALSQKKVRRAPVVNGDGKLVGVVSFDDLLPVIIKELDSLSKIVKS